MHDEFNCENVSDMAGSGYEQQGIRGEGSFDEGLKQNGHRDGGQNHLGGSVEKVGVRALAAPVSDIRNQLIS